MPRKPLTDADGEVRELTAEDFAAARPAREVLPPEFFTAMAEAKATRRAGRPKKAVRLTPVSIRLDPAIIAHFRAGGSGWQSRINAALLRALEEGRI